MYKRSVYQIADDATINAFIDQHPFAMLMGCDVQHRPVATQLPLFMEQVKEKRVVRGHMMKHMDHYTAFQENKNALVVFTGPWAYVSAQWYKNPNRASTVNYMSVHARGKLQFLGTDALAEILRKTSLYFENQNTYLPSVFDQLPADYTRQMMPHIVAFEIQITDLEVVFKLSQDQDEKNYEQIIEKLRVKDAPAQQVAKEMESRRQGLFPK